MRALGIIAVMTAFCWPALSAPAHIEAHRALVQKHAVVRYRLVLRKAMNQQEVDELRKEWK